jgi:hypothetical protein
VPVLIVVDGYQTYVNKYQFPINKENNQILVKNYAVMGYAGEKLMSSKQFSMVNKIRIKPPLLDFYNQISLNLSDRSYDAMILFPYPILSNPNSKGDLRFMYIIEVLECLESIGLNNLLVKVKDGNNGKDIERLREILSIHAHDNVEVTTGAFHKYVNLVTFVVGGVGTSIAESLYNDTPYYVYEPYYNGIVDSDINNSILNNSLIFRDIEALKTGILNRSYLMLDKENLFSGIKMSEIDFKEL